MRRLVALCALLATPVFADLPAVDVEQAWLDPAARGSLLVGNGQTFKALEFRAGVSLFYTNQNLHSQYGKLLENRLGFQVFGALGVTDWLQLGFNVPVIITQDGLLNPASAGLGNPWIHGKVSILDDSHPLAIAVDLGIGVPVGTAAAFGNGGLEAAPKVQVGQVGSTFQWGAEVGFLYRAVADFTPITGFTGDKVGPQLWAGFMGGTVNKYGPRGEFSLRLGVPFAGGSVGVEGQVGLRWPVGDVEIFASAGPGFFGESTPALRAYAGIAFGNAKLTRPPCIEGTDYDLKDCPLLDKDGDGVPNGIDKAPLRPEDKDGFQDEDGVPDPDNDGDKILDVNDRCPDQAGPAENQGCPDVDTDADGIVDRLDKCPTQAEDKDGFQDEDGCPDPDNDGDGILDADDACPNVAGLPELKGCPAKDSDGDGVMDHLDNCPAVKGEAANAGCPVAQKQLVVITKDKLKILDKVYFDAGKASIQNKSNLLLDNVAQVLLAHPELPGVRIEGYTDNQGKPEVNLKLSADRAGAVKAYLVKKGVAEPKLTAVGLGAEHPAEPNDTPAGREANRRVEFNLVQP